MIWLLLLLYVAQAAHGARRYTVFRSNTALSADATLAGFASQCVSTATSLGISTSNVFPIMAGRAELGSWDNSADVFLLGTYLTSGLNFRNGNVPPGPFSIYQVGPTGFFFWTGLQNGYVTGNTCGGWTTQVGGGSAGSVAWGVDPGFNWNFSPNSACSNIQHVLCAQDDPGATYRPSISPATPMPSLSPTTSRPSVSPTTSRPSAVPSVRPTNQRPSASPTTSFPTRSPVVGTPAPFVYPSERTAYVYPSRNQTVLNITHMDRVCLEELPPGFLPHVAASRLTAIVQAFLDTDTRPLSLLSNVTKFRTLTSFAPIAGSLDEFLNMRHPFGTQLTAIGAPCANCRNWTSSNPDNLMMLGFSRVRQYADSCFYLPNTTYLCAAVVDVDPFTPSPTYTPDP